MRVKIKRVNFGDDTIDFIKEKKYYIRSTFGDWQEVTKSQFEAYKKSLEQSVIKKRNLKEIYKQHLKIVEVLK